MDCRRLNDKSTEFQIDTGAEATLISEQVYKKVGSPPLATVHQTFRGPNKAVIPVVGQFMGKVKKGNRETLQEIYVVKNLNNPLLGRPAIQALGLVKRIEEVQVKKLNPVEQYPTLFKGLGKLPLLLQEEYQSPSRIG